ncbi:MAG: DNA-binding protein [Candidatus Fischerbacteria bacterium RBG_13_37_8]|uniref:DNA-binding protein n=1 Tax=Candidatus Fischerbacteria bacterium RBG_13_37_8 TaxID=1817863 RepID=A0A1F5V5W4_9BACT|nr:MAG: DNA-binding protein [Candidatus Fischerbacteria bacterium RBG_13_37_8]
MIEKNKKENIKEEITRASTAFDAAVLLFDNDFINDAISKLYYFLLYYMRALLLSKGFEPKTHEGALRLFGLHFVKKGIFPAKDSHIFSKLMKYREEADYNPMYIFTAEDFVELKKETEQLASKIKAYLKKKAYL